MIDTDKDYALSLQDLLLDFEELALPAIKDHALKVNKKNKKVDFLKAKYESNLVEMYQEIAKALNRGKKIINESHVMEGNLKHQWLKDIERTQKRLRVIKLSL